MKSPEGATGARPRPATQETLALLKMVALGNRQIEQGKVVPAAQAIRRARERIAGRR